MNRRKLVRWSGAALLSIGLAACSDSSESEDSAAAISAVPLQTGADDPTEESSSDETTTTLAAAPRPTSPSDLTATLPDEAPVEAGFEVITEGNGETVEAGDTVYLAWEMIVFGTGEIVESTAVDYGGPIEIPVGLGAVPAALEDAVIGQRVGTRLDVFFPADMADLPAQFDPTQAHVLAVDIVEISADTPGLPSGPEPTDESAAPADDPAPTTTAPPAPVDGLMVSAQGPLAATPPAGAALPGRNSSDLVVQGNGETVLEGDTVRIEYVMVSFRTGQVVKSTAQDFGGPQSIVLGDIEVPRNLEAAIFRQSVGSRLQVVYAPELLDLPEGLDRSDAYVVAVDIVSRAAG